MTGSITTSDLFDDVVRDMFSIADAQQKGHLTREEFESVRSSCLLVLKRWADICHVLRMHGAKHFPV